MRIADLPLPKCGPGEVLLKIAACGICGSDVRRYSSGDAVAGRGRIPGHEVTGTVVDAGPGRVEWQTGDRIALAAEVHCHACWYCQHELLQLCRNLKILGRDLDGGLAEFMLLTREILDHGVVNRVPQGLSLLDAAVSEPLCSVLASHDELEIMAGETVVVLGSGPMGILHHELLRSRGARVVMIDLIAERLERARRDFGAEWTIDASRDGAAARIGSLTGGIGADAVIVAAPSPAAVRQSLSLVRKRGRIGLFGGLPSGQAEVALDMNLIHYGELRLIGNFSYHPGQHRKALELLESGRIRCDKLITQYEIEATEEALEDIQKGRVLKAVIVPNSGELL